MIIHDYSETPVIAFSKLFPPFVFKIQFKLSFIELSFRLVELLVLEGVDGDKSIFAFVFCLSFLSLQLSSEKLQFQSLLNDCFSAQGQRI